MLVCVILLLTVKRHFGHDEFECIHSGWKILNGERIYEDFFQHHHPFYYYVNAAVIKVFGETVASILIMRLLSLAMVVAMVVGPLAAGFAYDEASGAPFAIATLACLGVIALSRGLDARVEPAQAPD